jgi:ABC-2 type transport system permease protein
MTAATPPARELGQAPGQVPAQMPVPPLAVRARDVLLCEWTKFRSVRSTYWTLLVAAVAAVGLSAVEAEALAAHPVPPGAPVNSLTISFLGLPDAVLALGVLGVLTFSTEFTTGLVRTTFAAIPRRRAVLAAKAAVLGVVALIVGELLAFASFFVTQAIMSGAGRGLSLSHPGAARAVLAAGLLLFVFATLALGLGAIIRHTAGAIVTLIAAIYLPLILLTLPRPWNTRIDRFTATVAAYQLVSEHPLPSLLSPALSLLVLLAWPAAALLAAAFLITRRDASLVSPHPARLTVRDMSGVWRGSR